MSKNIEDEIQAALHAQPATGSLDPRLDFFIKQAEVFIEDARQTIINKQPEGPSDQHKAIALEAMKQAVSSASWNVQLQTMSVDQSIELTRQQGEKMFAACAIRPANTPEERINRQWESLKAILDGLNGQAIFLRIKQELERAANFYQGDELSLFLLRGGERLILNYIEARRQFPDAYYEAVRDTAQVYETEIKEACETVLLSRRLEKTWPGIKDALSKQLISLNSLAEKQALSWQRGSGSISVQSDSSGAVNVSFPDMASFRAWARSPH